MTVSVADVISRPRESHADLSRFGQLCLLPLFGGILFQLSAHIYNGMKQAKVFINKIKGASTYLILRHFSAAE
jgi:hypothetical protein